MKRIIKRNAPIWFEEWKKKFERSNRRKPQYKGDFSTDTNEGGERRVRLRNDLITEQGKICCYCMNRITQSSSHIEHFWPKEQFKLLDMDYDNLLASCNGENATMLGDEHCGHRKNNWWKSDMISPIDNEIGKMFKYTIDGKIHSAAGRTTSNIADEMIHNMGLDSYHLERNRRQAIESSEVYDVQEYTADDIRDLIQYYSNMDNGEYVPYCQAIVDCLIDLI